MRPAPCLALVCLMGFVDANGCSCQNGGACLDSQECDCTDTGYGGDQCEVNECSCQNGGTCLDTGECDCTDTGYGVVTCPHTMTLSGYNYHRVPLPAVNSTADSLVFRVRSCMNVHFALSSSLNLSSQMVEIVIGAGHNAFQSIRDCQQACDLRSKFGSYLSCDDYVPFWLAWETSSVTSVALGLGNKPIEDMLLSASPGYVMPINYVSIASYGTTEATWQFDFPEQTNPENCEEATTTAVPTTQTPAVPAQTATLTELTVTQPASQSVATSTRQRTTLSETTTTTATQPFRSTTTNDPTTTTSDFPEQTNPENCEETTTTAVPTTQTPAVPAQTATLTELTVTQSASQSVATSTRQRTTLSETTTTTATQPFRSTTTNDPTTTTSATSQHQRCSCVANNAISGQARDSANQAAEDTKMTLTMTNPSAYRRSKTSAKDPRPSAQTLGSVGVALLLVVLLVIVVPDLVALVTWVFKACSESQS